MGKTGRENVSVFLVLIAFLFLMFGTDNLNASNNIMLDEETVFCLFHKLSGEKINSQDMEDLYFRMGKPYFSDHKPAEIFTKNSLKHLRFRLMEKINKIEKDTIFSLRVKLNGKSNGSGMKSLDGYFTEEIIPSATSFINAKIDKKGEKLIHSFLRSEKIGKKLSNSTENPEIIISFKADGIEYRYEKRNVAMEDIVLPLRYVIFRPIKMQLMDEIFETGL